MKTKNIKNRWFIDYGKDLFTNNYSNSLQIRIRNEVKGFCDYPILYFNGNIAYDNPERIPKYIKKFVGEIFDKIKV